jgi:N-acetylneuraminate synthase
MKIDFPFVIAEIGINHEGIMERAFRMIRDAYDAGCQVVKFQTHIIDDEYVPCARKIIPSNADENIYDMMKRCSLNEAQETSLKVYTEKFGMQYLSTPFSRAAVDRLEHMGVTMYKVGSGECNNYPLIKHIVSTGKPIILSTGMNSFDSVDKAVDIIGDQLYAVLHCVSEYPTPYAHVNLPRMLELKEMYHVRVGLSDHSVGIYTALAAVAMGADVIEKHFTSDKTWAGSDIPISITPDELRNLIVGIKAITQSLEKHNGILDDNSRTSEFAFASVVSIKHIRIGDTFDEENIWVKRPNGEIPASEYDIILGKLATRNIPKDTQLKRSDIG